MAKGIASYEGCAKTPTLEPHHVSMKMKGKTYRAVVLYVAKSMTTYTYLVGKFHAFMMQLFRPISKITWTDK